jgi:hypothetical protein
MADKKISFDKLGKALSSTGTYVANNKKPLLYVGGAIAIVVIGYAVVKRIKGGIAGEKIIGGKFVDQEVDLNKTSINLTTAKNYAENLFEAFNYTWGTDKSTINSIFSKINSEDFKMIYNAFGKRSYSSLNGGSPSGKWWSPDTLVGSVKLDLIQWINNELEWGDSALREKIRKVVEPAGFIIEK